jgi:Leucine-rich repeat (LRR) protein
MIRVHLSLEFLLLFFLTGEIPTSLGNCIQLTKLWLNDNQLTGECVIQHVGLPSKLQVFFLTGKIPDSLGNCTKLTTLHLFQNRLEGKL